MSTEANKAPAGRLDAILTTADPGRLDQLCRPDMASHSLAPGRPAGLEGTRQWLAADGREFASFRRRELPGVAGGDLVVQAGVRGGRRPGGASRGFDVPAGPDQPDTAFIYRIAGDRIAERRAANDHLALLSQPGAIPGPTATASRPHDSGGHDDVP